MKKRYAVGYYNHKERLEEEGWWNNCQNRLVTYIYDNQDMFDIRYISHSEDGNRAWILLDTKELNKAKEYFTHSEDVTDTLEWIDACNDYDKWKTSCVCCDTITINAIPYTYREFGGCVGREYNCLLCSGLNNRTAYKVSEEQRNNGTETAIDFLIDILEDRYTDEEEKYYCKCCDRDMRYVGLIKDSKTIYKPTYKGEFIGLDVEEYNKQEEEFEKEIEGYYPCYISEQDNAKKGYVCFECGHEVSEELAKEIIGL